MKFAKAAKRDKERAPRQAKPKKERSREDKFFVRIPVRAMYAVFAVITLLTMALAVVPKSYALEVGVVAPEDIYAPREVEDTLSTTELRQRASDAVKDVYTQDGSITTSVNDQVKAYMDGVDAARAAGLLEYDNAISAWETGGREGSKPTIANTVKGDQLHALTAQVPISISDSEMLALLQMTQSQWDTAKAAAQQAVGDALEAGIQQDKIDQTLTSITATINALDVSDAVKTAALRPVRTYIRANAFLDEAATQAARVKAEESVAPVVYKKGQIILRMGEVVTEKHMSVLRDAGLIAGKYNWGMYAGVVICVAFMTATIWLYMHRFLKAYAKDTEKTSLILLVVWGMLLIAAVMQKFELYLVPIPLAAMLIALGSDAKTGILMGCLVTLNIALIALAAGLETQRVLFFLAAGWIGSITGGGIVKQTQTRTGIVVIGLFSGLSMAAIYLTAGMMLAVAWREIVWMMTMALACGAVSGILCLGTTPFWESCFHVLTPMKLMELCNPTNPLLKRLMFEAPGTYHHSVMVGNLAEAAAEDLGANALLARVGSYYHDVGKLAAPRFFSENQPAGTENPHDHLTPRESARLIARHPIDSAKYIRAAGLAKPIEDIARQHHGTSVMMYFYSKAAEENPDVNVDDFRHTGGLPQTVEAAIVMLADCCEAATRSAGGEYKPRIRALVQDRLDDGQLDKVPLTLKDLDTIVNAFDRVLRGAYHGRIQYPDTKLPKRAEAHMMPAEREEEETVYETDSD